MSNQDGKRQSPQKLPHGEEAAPGAQQPPRDGGSQDREQRGRARSLPLQIQAPWIGFAKPEDLRQQSSAEPVPGPDGSREGAREPEASSHG